MWEKKLSFGQIGLPLVIRNGNAIVAFEKGLNSRRIIALSSFTPTGEVVFEKSYDSGKESRIDWVYELIITEDGYAIAGFIQDASIDKLYLLKLNNDGNLQWDWSFGNTKQVGRLGSAIFTKNNIFAWGALEKANSVNSRNAENLLVKLTLDGKLSPCQQEGF